MSALVAIQWSLWVAALLVVAIALWRRRASVTAKSGIALAAGISVVIVDVFAVIALREHSVASEALRAIPALVCLPVLAWARDWKWRELGFRLPEQSLKTWIVWTAILGACGVVLAGIAIAVFAATGWTVPIPGAPPLAAFLISAALIAPLLEELIYRAALCPPTETLLGPRSAIVVSGLVFAAIHYIYGNPGPDNLVGGFILAWAFVKSRSILVPIVLHALGNLLVYAALLAIELILL